MLTDLSSCQPHLNVLPQAPFKSLRSSSLQPPDSSLRSSLSSCSLALPFLSPHPATLIALLCQMSQPIVPPVKSWWGVCPIQPSKLVGLGKLNKEGRDEWSSLLNADAISSCTDSHRLPQAACNRFPASHESQVSGTHIFAVSNLMSVLFSWINWCAYWVTDT